MARIVTITDGDSVILERFVVSNKDAKKIADDYSTECFDADELKEYLKESGE
jgi:hypothetical protein